MFRKTVRTARSIPILVASRKKINWQPYGARSRSRGLGAGDTSNFIKRKYCAQNEFCGYCATPLTQYKVSTYKLDCLHDIHNECVCHAMLNRAGRVSCWICSGWTEFRCDYSANEEEGRTCSDSPAQSRKKATMWRVQRGVNGAIVYPIEDTSPSGADQRLVEIAEFEPARLLLYGAALPSRPTGSTMLALFPPQAESADDDDEQCSKRRRQQEALDHLVQLAAYVLKSYPQDLCQRLYDHCLEKFAEPERARFAAAIHKHLVRVLNNVPADEQQRELKTCFKHVEKHFLMSFAEQVFNEMGPDYQHEFLLTKERILAEKLRLIVHGVEFWHFDQRREFMNDLNAADHDEQQLFAKALKHLSKSERLTLQSALATFGYIDLDVDSARDETELFQAIESARVNQGNFPHEMPNRNEYLQELGGLGISGLQMRNTNESSRNLTDRPINIPNYPFRMSYRR